VETVTETLGGQADQIMSEREDWGLAAICLTVILLSLGGIVAAVLTGLLPGLDGLLLLLICLMMIAIFAPPLAALAKQKGWLPARGKKAPPKDSEEGK
jgi:hypothetical protein